MASVYEYGVRTAAGGTQPMAQYAGKVLVIVNTASLCGYTPQYAELEQLYQKYHHQGLEILAFPCNQFAGEEPLAIAEVVRNVRQQFGVTFPIFDKVLVNGDNADPLYRFLKHRQRGKLGFEGVMWNFEKFVVDRHGNVVYRFLSEVTPSSFEPHIKALLS